MLRSGFSIWLLAMLSAATFADDLTPPPWRGQPGTTFQKWTFSDDTLPRRPDPLWVNEAGEPTHLFSLGIQWEFNHEGRPGVYKVDPTKWLAFNIPNFDRPTHTKDVRVQVTWRSGNASTSVETATQVFLGEKKQMDLAGGWKHTTWDIKMSLCPKEEFVFVTNGGTDPMFVDQVVIDTRCVPEPTSLATLALGVAWLARRRTRKA